MIKAIWFIFLVFGSYSYASEEIYGLTIGCSYGEGKHSLIRDCLSRTDKQNLKIDTGKRSYTYGLKELEKLSNRALFKLTDRFSVSGYLKGMGGGGLFIDITELSSKQTIVSGTIKLSSNKVTRIDLDNGVVAKAYQDVLAKRAEVEKVEQVRLRNKNNLEQTEKVQGKDKHSPVKVAKSTKKETTKKSKKAQKKAERWAKQQSEFNLAKENVQAGVEGSMQRLGAMYFLGWGTEKNCDKAFKLLISAANQGSAKAQYRLGQMYESGCKTVKQHKVNAFNWFYACMADKKLYSHCFSKAKHIVLDNPSQGSSFTVWKARALNFIKDFYGDEIYERRVAANNADVKSRKDHENKMKYNALSILASFDDVVTAVAVNCPNSFQSVESMLARQMKRFKNAEYLESVGDDAMGHYQTILNQLSPERNLYLQGLQRQGCY